VSNVRRNCRSTSLLVVIGFVAVAGDAISIARFSVGVSGLELLGNQSARVRVVSNFSATHYVRLRALTARLGFHF
jgi:hypothetical protein